VPHAGDTPGLFQLYTPTDKDLAASFLARAQKTGYKAVVVTLDTWTTGWRPRDLNTGNFPQLLDDARQVHGPGSRPHRCRGHA
jgi:lactate 2-monooxygenase